jgi:hypothetical protein
MQTRNAVRARNERALAGKAMPGLTPIAAIGLCIGFCIVALGFTCGASAKERNAPFGSLNVYNGDWAVRALHPWSAAIAGAVDRLKSRCQTFTRYFACEQTVNGKPQALIVYTIGADSARFTRARLRRTASRAGVAI